MELHLQIRVRPLARPGKRGAEVVVLEFQSLQPLDLLWTAQLGNSPLRELEIDLGVSLACRVCFPALGEHLEGVLPDRLKHREPRIALW